MLHQKLERDDASKKRRRARGERCCSTTPIETDDLILRSLDVGYAHGPYAAWMRDAEVTRFLEVRFAPPDEVALAAFIVRMNGSDDNLLLGLFPRDGAAAPYR